MTPQPPGERDWIDYLDGRLASPERERFDAWLAAHPEQERECRELERLLADCAELPPLPVPDSTLNAARAGLMAAVRQLDGGGDADSAPAPARRRADRARPLPWLAPLTAAAALVVGVLIGRSTESGTRLGAGPDLGALQPAAAIDGGAWDLHSQPRSRHVAVQDLAVAPGEDVRIRLNETNSYEVAGPASSGRIQSYLSYILRNDGDPERRRQAVALLDRHCDGNEVCEVLVYALTQDPSRAVREAAAGALADESADPLVRRSFFKMAVEDPAPELRDLAAKVLDEGQRQELGR